MRGARTWYFRRDAHILSVIYGTACRQGLKSRLMYKGQVGAVMHWLLSDCHLFGLPMQNWVWVFPGALVLYGVILIYIRSRRAKLRP